MTTFDENELDSVNDKAPFINVLPKRESSQSDYIKVDSGLDLSAVRETIKELDT